MTESQFLPGSNLTSHGKPNIKTTLDGSIEIVFFLLLPPSHPCIPAIDMGFT